VLANGAVMNVPNAITGDTLRLNVFATGHATVHLLVHNFQEVFKQQTLVLKAGGVRALLLLGILTEQKIYEKRQQVKVHFQLTSDQPAEGWASVSCAQANRFENSKHQDIESFTYLNAALQDLPVYANGYNNTDHLEKILLVRGWRRYAWQEAMAVNQQPVSFFAPEFSGKVITGSSKIKKPLMVTILNGLTGRPWTLTDTEGNFLCTYDQLMVDQSKKLWLSEGDKVSGHKVIMNDPFITINTKLAAGMQFNAIDADKYIQFARELSLTDVSRLKQLAVVYVKANKDTDKSMGPATQNACGDFVCSYNKLNCNGHVGDPGNTVPIKGKSYRMNGGGMMIYTGCTWEELHNGILHYEGIKVGKEFYKIDLSEASLTQLTSSTIFWSPNLVFDKEGKAEADFYTGEITGRFRIVVNGMAGGNLFHTTAILDVK
jgi:hypothetical protein